MPTRPVVILTQAEPDNARLAGLLHERGLASVSYPCLATEYIAFDPSAAIAGRSIADYAVLVFTSRRGAHGFAPARAALGQAPPVVACIGDGTVAAVEEVLGLNCDILPEADKTGAGLAQAISATGAPRPLLHVRGTKTTGTLKQELERGGWTVGELIVYRSFAPANPPLTIDGPAVGVFASPSAAQHFFKVNSQFQGTLPCVAIGPVTGDCLRNIGMMNITEARQPDPASVAAAIELITRENM